jgi:hypothetical protein
VARRAALVAAVALLVPGASPAAVADDLRLVRSGLDHSVEVGWLSTADAGRYRTVAAQAAQTSRRLPSPRARELAAVLHRIAGLHLGYTRPRALALFSMLDLNRRHLGGASLPPAGRDVYDADGVVYRSFPGSGLQFHPLGNFARLQSLFAQARYVEAERLAGALVERGVPVAGGGLAWEYYFPFGGGRPPWTSGMAQAVAAQALARVGAAAEARRAYLAAARLVLSLPTGPWIRLYSFSPLRVLNAQLQAAVSLADYAELAADPAAAPLATRLRDGAAALLPQFDTGYWSLYALGGSEATLGYHRYVVQLLRRLAGQTGETAWREWAARFELYLEQPPLLRPQPIVHPLYPVPAEGFRDEAVIRFWLSKRSRVSLSIGGEMQSAWFSQGQHRLTWRPGERRPGQYLARLSAVDLAGNRGAAEPFELEVARDTQPPELLTATLTGSVLRWSALDEETPWLRLRLLVRRSSGWKTLDLGTRPLSGVLRVRLPRGVLAATLVVSDSSRNRAQLRVL